MQFFPPLLAEYRLDRDLWTAQRFNFAVLDRISNEYVCRVWKKQACLKSRLKDTQTWKLGDLSFYLALLQCIKAETNVPFCSELPPGPHW